jgi:hypothetical protein
VWILAALFAVPSALSGHLCLLTSAEGSELYYQRVVVFELLVSCVLPLSVIAFSYIMTARSLVKKVHLISEDTQNPQMNKRKKIAKIVLALTTVFLISYLPYHGLWTYIISNTGPFNDKDYIYDINEYKIRNRYTYLVSTCLLLINPCLNPVALFCTGRAFRRQFRRYLTCCCKGNLTATDIEVARRN